jgi:response regulator RpfG family c-di-GMP phosphodiesterase
MDSIKVLCVENNPDSAYILQQLLEDVGYEVIEADSGKQAISLFAAEPVSGVLLEYDLSDSNGVAVRREMKRLRPEVPVLLFSGVGPQTPMLLRFFDAYLRPAETGDSSFDGVYT